jgi:hypothetical protein
MVKALIQIHLLFATGRKYSKLMQLFDYEADPYFLQLSQNMATDSCIGFFEENITDEHERK